MENKYFIYFDKNNQWYGVFAKTGRGFSQQVSKWYIRQGDAKRKLNKLLQNA